MTTKAELTVPLTAIGLMSGTSLDGIDAAVIRTDGETVTELGPTHYQPYTEAQVRDIRALVDESVARGRDVVGTDVANRAERALTLANRDAVRTLMEVNGLTADEIDLVGFHGQTIMHRPDERWTWQLGDGALLAAELGIDVVCDFRSADVKAGGEGAPFAPLYHQALLAADAQRDNVAVRNVAVLNVGGVGNVTYVGENDILAFDTGPGNGLINDWIERHTGKGFDDGGEIAAAGQVDAARIAGALVNPYFERVPPKSLDRTDFNAAFADGLSLEEGAATLTAFTAASVRRAVEHLPAVPDRWYVCGGGRKNPHLMTVLEDELGKPVGPVEELGWRGDFLEAEAFGFLAVRSIRGLPLSLPTTTGVPQPMTGGLLFRSDQARSA